MKWKEKKKEMTVGIKEDRYVVIQAQKYILQLKHFEATEKLQK